MGHAGFMSLGAYTAAILSVHFATPFFLAIIGGALMAALFGFLIGIPTLRLEGDYSGHGHHWFRGNSAGILFLNFEPGGKAVGFSGIPQATTFTTVWLDGHCGDYLEYPAFQIPGGAIPVCNPGNEIAAEACGINTTRMKVLAFTVGSFWRAGRRLYAALYVLYQSPGLWLHEIHRNTEYGGPGRYGQHPRHHYRGSHTDSSPGGPAGWWPSIDCSFTEHCW